MVLMNKKYALIVAEKPVDTSNLILEEVLKKFGCELEVCSEFNKRKLRHFSLIFLRISGKKNETELIKNIKNRNPGINVVVISPDPVWKQARQVILSGADDYIRISDDEEYLSCMLSKFFPDQVQKGFYDENVITGR